MEQESVESSDNEARRAGLKEDTPVVRETVTPLMSL